MVTLETYLLGGIGLFLVIVVILAYIGWNKTNNMSDFALAGETLGPYMLGAAYAATFFSAATFVGYVGWSYDFGLSNIWLFLTLIGASPIALVLIAKQVRESNTELRALSLPDWLGAYYDSQIMRVGAAVSVMFNLFYIGAQFSAGAQMFEVLLGWDYITGLTFVALLVTLYVLAGASYADIYTDAVQGLLMAIMGLIIFLSAFGTLNTGPTGFFSTISSGLSSQDVSLIRPINSDSTVYFSTFAITSIFVLQFAFAAQPQLFNKVLALNDPKNLRKMIGTYVFLALLFLLVIFAGFYLRVLDPGLEAADQAIFIYVESYFPPIVAAFLGVVILSAALSTTDGHYIVLSTAVGNDIFRRFLVDEGYIEMEDKRADRVARYIAQMMVVVIGVIAYLLVINPPAYIGAIVWVGIAGVAAATVPSVLFGVIFPDFVTRKGAIASLVVGGVGYILVALFYENPSVFIKGAIALIASSIVMLAVSAITDQENAVAGNRSPAQSASGEQPPDN